MPLVNNEIHIISNDNGEHLVTVRNDTIGKIKTVEDGFISTNSLDSDYPWTGSPFFKTLDGAASWIAHCDGIIHRTNVVEEPHWRF